jgi:PAS domain S-box-containing protein
MLWLIFLGVAIFLVIALRRVLRKQRPLDDALYSSKVAVDHVQSGVAWVRGDGTFGSVNEAFAKAFQVAPVALVGHEWSRVFKAGDQARVLESYSQMMLSGINSLEAEGIRADGSIAWLNVRLVPVHDEQTRFAGHYCMIEDKTREHDLEEQVSVLEALLQHTPADQPADKPVSSLDALKRATGRSVISVLNNAKKTDVQESVSRTTAVR